MTTGEFLCLAETAGFIVVRGNPEEVFFKYWYDKEKPKIIYSHYRRRIPNSFCSTTFNRNHSVVESDELEDDFFKLYFFLQLVTDRIEEINEYLKM